GRRVDDVLPELAPRLMPVYQRVLDTGVPVINREHSRETTEGALRHFLANYCPVCVADETIGVAVLVVDITERKRAEHAAEEANRIKDEFLATMSHELRTPLTAILGWTRMLETGVLPEARRTWALEVIERNAKAQAQLIEDLLDVSRIVHGKLRVERALIDAGSVVEAALEAVRPTAEAKGLRFDLTRTRSALMIMGDAVRIRQIVWNLLTNAVKFTPSGGRIWTNLR